ncbi:LolA family protein [Halalkalibacter nanhaiisediminis]|uniref:Outer membrane lipoprotein-sorting protein n=1 Tax=Halalkalibacter nanhaiisediminis TaxID=688079 RepID=A0A562QD04_9BACI|nr:outer membrane lipoprotein carrier protein LolA [Halalkalibacter nanhaiisediminis]TWI54040.1 outer membrane lipoprotein-sorting protein [Halalkalibacter nanhaiisediminis]
MRKAIWFAALGLLLSVILVGCGEKTQEDIMTDLEKKLTEMTGYKAASTMTLETGNEPQTYEVDVWHQTKSYYRVALKNQNKDQSQIILRNDDGVFVLTPALNKSFRFQSDWPTNSSQVYLYESLVQDILMDPERTFQATEDHYVFQTNTNYQNKNLSTQEITLNKKDLTPAQVKIMNTDLEVLVQLDFTSFEWNSSFNDGDFDMERNMTGAQMAEEPAMAEPMEALTVYYPMYTPDGTEFDSSQTIEAETGQRVVLQYMGEQPFTLIQEQSQVVPAATPMSVSQGEPVDLGFTIGVMTDESLMWSYNGVDFLLASATLDTEEMMAIARSVYGTHEK